MLVDRHHRALQRDARELEEAIVRKRSELEDSIIRVEELHAAIAHREAALAVLKPARKQAAQELYAQLEADADADLEELGYDEATADVASGMHASTSPIAPSQEASQALAYLQGLLPAGSRAAPAR